MPARDRQVTKKNMFQGSLLCLGGVFFNEFLRTLGPTPRAVTAAYLAMLVGGAQCAVELLRYSRATKILLLVWSGLSLGVVVLIASFWGALPKEATGGDPFGAFAVDQFRIWALVTSVVALVAAGFGGARESFKGMAAALRASPGEKWAAARGLAPVTDPTRRYECEGFSVQPPAGDNWFAAQRPMGVLEQLKMRPNLTFTKIAGSADLARRRSLVDRLRRTQASDPSTTVAQVRSGFIDVPAANGTDVLEQIARERSATDQKETASGGRFRAVQFRTSPDTSLGTECLWYDCISEDRGVPWQRGTVFDLSEHGVLCTHPDCRWFVIDADYSQRIPRGTLHADSREEAESFLRSLRFNRLERPLPVAVIAVGSHPRAVAIGENAIWVASVSDDTVSRIDPGTNEVVATIPVGRNPAGVAVRDGAVWVANLQGATISRIDSTTNRVTAVIPVGKEPLLVAADSTGVWLTHSGGDCVSRIDAKTNQLAATIRVGRGPSGVAVGGGFVWVTGGKGGLVRIDPRTNRLVGDPIRVGDGPRLIAFGEGAVWVAGPASPTVMRVDPTASRVVATIPVGSSPSTIAVGGGAVWTTNPEKRAISKIDPQINRVVGTIPVAGRPFGIAVDGDIWVANGAGNTVQRFAF